MLSLTPPPSSWFATAIACLLVGCGGSASDTSVESVPVESAPSAQPAPVIAAAPDDGLVEDNGRTLWVSPTNGESIDLSIVPDGSDLVLHLRPAELLKSEEGRRVWRALGPLGEPAAKELASATDQPFDELDTLVIGVAAGENYNEPKTTLVTNPQPSDILPLLQREIEQLLDTSDRDRHATLIFSPRFLLGDGGSLLDGQGEPIRELLLAQVRDEWAAAAFSLHLDASERLYWELRVIANAAEPETRTAKGLAQQADGWSNDLASVVTERTWSPYSVALIQRSPQMLAVVGKYARRGTDGRQAVVNGYGPPGAAHQLLLVAERIVAESAAPPAIVESLDKAAENTSLADRLQRPVTLSFRRESLETTLTILSDAMGLPITLRGRDLQLEGITRNQMLELDVTDLPAGDVLLEILRRANPDPLATGPSDERQRLVYVIEAGGIQITTRAAAKQRNESLPAAFTDND